MSSNLSKPPASGSPPQASIEPPGGRASAPSPHDWYRDNPLVQADRRLGQSPSEWARSFGCEEIGVLIVCRGPIRKEAIDILREMGVERVGILLSEKDSIVYTHALAPELRFVHSDHVHPVRDYSGATKEERLERIEEILAIAHRHGYGYIFAGYGFMAEDEVFVRSIEEAGLRFIGPRASVQGAAGQKDAAKRTALAAGVSVTPGIDDLTSRALLAAHPNREALAALAAARGLELEALDDEAASLSSLAADLLALARRRGIDLLTLEALGAQAERELDALIEAYPDRRFRLKAIGGGGGKGQRIVSRASEAPERLREILAEVKALGEGDDKNVLIELNVETTRHHEIQLVGNGSWCVSLGGRDCSIQMHEQKLLEISLTLEEFDEEIERSRVLGKAARVQALLEDRRTLARMEQEAARFGEAVGLDSASTFECIVDGIDHFFMEVNTRIQVEHRVSELCYGLRFANPERPSEYFDVPSLVQAMVLLAVHGSRLPKPSRIRRETAAVEARLNATDASLSPHAGGKIWSWSAPIEGEIRDDQGICYENPDTGLFKHYRIAGAYDSNIALLVTTGEGRSRSFERLCEIVRAKRLRGEDLATNLHFHYGLVSWFRARDVFAKPTTAFVVPYLTQVGLLAEAASEVDLAQANRALLHRHGAERAPILALKQTLIRRPLERLLEDAHLFSAWLSEFCADYRIEAGAIGWNRNPLEVLRDTYHLLNMDPQPGQPAAFGIWDQDRALLERGLGFYERLGARLEGPLDWRALEARLELEAPPAGFDDALWAKVRGAHLGFQAGLELLGLLPAIGDSAGFYELRIGEDLRPQIPARLREPELQRRMLRVLAPPPMANSDTIVAPSGGMFYAQEAPGMPALALPGQRFERGDALFIVEVMKMFNKVCAPFAGVIEEVLVEGDATIVRKGQPVLRVRPDEPPVLEDPQERASRRQARTEALLAAI